MPIFVGRNWKPLINRKKTTFPGYREFPDSAHGNEHLILILHVKKIASFQSVKYCRVALVCLSCPFLGPTLIRQEKKYVLLHSKSS